jgi:hypothetical protein
MDSEFVDQRLENCLQIEEAFMNASDLDASEDQIMQLFEEYDRCVADGYLEGTAAGTSSLEVSITGVKVDGDAWLIVLVLVAVPAIYAFKKWIDKKFR